MEQLLQATANNGLAIVLVILGAWFAVSKVWPYVTKRQDRLDEEENSASMQTPSNQNAATASI
jgi:hypothetical protein